MANENGGDKKEQLEKVLKNARIVHISEINQDQLNANLGTERGRYMLEKSIEELGAGRSLLLDNNNNAIAGNKTLETWASLGNEYVLVIPNEAGELLVAVQREDLDIYSENDRRGRMMAYMDNRVAEVDISFDPSRIVADVDDGLDLSGIFFEDELAEIRRKVEDFSDKVDLTGFDEVGIDNIAYRVVVDGLTYTEAVDMSEGMPNSRVEQYRT